jgi:hypothetical protein
MDWIRNGRMTRTATALYRDALTDSEIGTAKIAIHPQDVPDERIGLF